MAQSVLIIAESGCGKSTSIESLDPKETFIINVANKPLPFKGWKTKYPAFDLISKKGNCANVSTPKDIEAVLRIINNDRKEIKNIVIDDFQYMSAFEYFGRATEKGFDKFTQMGAALAHIAKLPILMRDDLMVFYLTHAEEATDLEGRRKVKAKTIGKLVDDKLTLEGLYSIVLFGKVKKDKDGNMRYVFETQNNGENTCKSPRGMFPTFEIQNSLQLVRDAIQEYEK
jgi:hypothetical protein